MDTPNIRCVTLNDAHAIAEIYRPIVESTVISFEYEPPDAREMRRRIGAVLRSYPWLVAELDGVVAGYAYGHRHREREGYRHSVEVSVYLAERARGRGIGRMLYAELFERLRTQGLHRAFAGIALPNNASIALHERCGFQPIGIFPEIGRKFDRWVDVAWYQRSVQNRASLTADTP